LRFCRAVREIRFDSLTLHAEKTRLIEFGRYAAKNARKQGKKPATFNFLGFVRICARSRQGKFTVQVKTIAKRLGRGLKAVLEWCKRHRHDPVSEQQKNPERQAPRPLPVLQTTYELPRYSAVLSQSPSHLAGMAEPPDTWKAADVGEV
jgi:hypothetical protein